MSDRADPANARQAMFSPPLPPNLAIGSYQFSAPQLWLQAAAPVGGGLYALLAADPLGSPDYRLISVGEAENPRATILRLRMGALQQLLRDYRSRIYVAWLSLAA